MFNSFKAKSAGGWKDKKKSYGGSDSRPSVEMHEATCSQCNKSCQVPFKPNGRKPVFCSDCFRRDENQDDRPSYGEKRPSFREDRGDRFERSFDRPERSYERAERAPEPRQSNDRQLAEVLGEMRIMNSKLEAILKALTVGKE